MTDIASPAKRPGTVRSSGRERRQQILEAVLRLIARQGIRAVRHRAVAKEAGVPLAATTYYFENIQALLKEAFVYFAETKGRYLQEYQHQMAEFLAGYPAARGEQRLQLARGLRDRTVDYVVQQAESADDRTVELAFKHEALRDEVLRELVLDQDRRFLQDILQFTESIGSEDPRSDAELTLSIIFRLEQDAVIGGLDRDKIKRVLTRHLNHLLRIEVG